MDVVQSIKSLPTMRDTQVRSLGREDPLEKEMATYYSTLAWRIPGTEKPGRLQSTGWKELDTTERLHFTSDSILKSRDITLPTKVRLVKTMVFPVVMYGDYKES